MLRRSLAAMAPLLRHEPPYWHTFTTNAKMRWFGRPVLEVLVEEFRERTKHYYAWAIHKGLLKVNGKNVLPTYEIQNGDVITHTAHKHEPPITADPVRVLHRDDEAGRLVVVKPGSVPVHPAGRYLRHTLLELLKSDLGFERVLTANRLDRLTSGIMVAATTVPAVKVLNTAFNTGKVRKAYVCRVKGCFPEGETVCNVPLLTLDRQTGVVIGHPVGREAKTLFNRLSYDSSSDTSVLFCRPVTGRTHQIRVHAQLLGHPIPNDPIYNHHIWETHPPGSLAEIAVPSLDRKAVAAASPSAATNINGEITKFLCASPPCAAIIEALKNTKDEGEDFSRLKDELKFAQLNKELGWLEAEAITEGVNAGPAKGTVTSASNSEGPLDGWCTECHLPLLPDPEPESLFIYLHAIRYETDEWSYEDEMPWWALDDWKDEGAMQRAADRRESGQSVRPPRLQLISESEEASIAEPGVPSADSGSNAPAAAETALAPTTTRDEKEISCGISSTAIVRPRDRSTPLLLTRPTQEQTFEALPASSDSTPSVPLARNHPPVVLEVFRGLEDFACHDLLSRFGATGRSADGSDCESALLSSFLILPTEGLSNFAKRQPLPFVSGKHLLIGRRNLPNDLLRHLADDRRSLGTSRKSGKVGKSGRRGGKGRHVNGQRNRELAAQAKAQLLTGSADPASATTTRADQVQRLADGSLASETRLIELLASLWRDNETSIKAGIEEWKEFMVACGGPDAVRGNWSWRASVDRSAYKLPTLVTTQLERALGDCVWTTFNGTSTPETREEIVHPVSLTAPDLEIKIVFVPLLGGELKVNSQNPTEQYPSEQPQNFMQTWENSPPGSLLLLFKLAHVDDEHKSRAPMPSSLSRQHPHRPRVDTDLLDAGTPLARFRAYSLVSLLPLPSSQSASVGPADPLKLWEPCVGSGSVAVEMAQAMWERRQVSGDETSARAIVYGSDIDEHEIDRARQVSRLSGWPSACDPQSGGGPDHRGVELHFRAFDLLRDFEEGADGGSIRADQRPQNSATDRSWFGPSQLDGVVTDLPWGMRVLSHGALEVLYTRFLQACALYLKPHHYAVAMTLEHKTLQRAARAAENLARRRGEAWTMQIEELSIEGRPSAHDDQNLASCGTLRDLERQGHKQAQEFGGVRVVEMGLRPYVALLRKVPLAQTEVY